MFSSYFIKSFAGFALIFLLFSGCRFFRETNNETNTSAAPAVSDTLKSEIPFTAKEPEIFQAEIVVTTGGTERVTFIARSGANRRWDFNFGKQNQLTNLQTDKNYLILPGKKVYAENMPAPAPAPDDWANFLTTEWLNEKTDAKFEKLETAGNLTGYRVSAGAASEVLIYLDEKAGLPVKQEFYTISGEQKRLTYTFELKNLKLAADANLFAVPTDFKKISVEELRKITQNEGKNE